MAVITRVKEINSKYEFFAFTVYILTCGAVTIFGAVSQIDAMWIAGLAFMGLPANGIVMKLWSGSDMQKVLTIIQGMIVDMLGQKKKADVAVEDFEMLKKTMREYIKVQEEIQTKDFDIPKPK